MKYVPEKILVMKKLVLWSPGPLSYESFMKNLQNSSTPLPPLTYLMYVP